MSAPVKSRYRCAIYTRKSSEEGLDQSFNSLHAQREACEAYIASQRHEGWKLVSTAFDDGGFSGGNMDRPALQHLLKAIASGQVDIVVVYKVDRLTRSLADFAKMVESFDKHGVSFVSVTQQFNTTSSMGRLTLNVLLSFAQFEREVTGERIRDKIAASKRKGMWMGGITPLGYDCVERKLVVNEKEAALVRQIYADYLKIGNVLDLKKSLDERGILSKLRSGVRAGGASFGRGALYHLLTNPVYLGMISHRGQVYPGQHDAILDQTLWDAAAAQLKQSGQIKGIRRSSETPGFLTGKLFDEEGNRYTPTFAVRRGRRYHYYTSQAVIQKKQTSHPLNRVSANDIESVVLRRLRTFLVSAEEPAQLGRTKDEMQRIQQAAASKLKAFSTDVLLEQEWAARVVRTVVLSPESFRIELDCKELMLSMGLNRPQREEFASLWLDGSHSMQKASGQRFVIPAEGESSTRPVPAVVKALARAHLWAEQIQGGRYQSMEAMARDKRIRASYLIKILRLAWLAPNTVEDLTNTKRGSLSVTQLIKAIPLDWKEQIPVVSQFEGLLEGTALVDS